MSQAVSRGQALQVPARIGLQVDWESLDGDALQKDVIDLSSAEFGRRFTLFLKNGANFVLKGPSMLSIDRSKPFNPRFVGFDLSIAEEDQRALAVKEIDFLKVRFEYALKEGEQSSTGKHKLERLKAMPEVRLDAATGQALYEEKGQATLRWLYDTFDIDWFELAGTVLQDPYGRRCFLGLRRDNGSWSTYSHWLDDRDRFSRHPFPLLTAL